MKKIFASIFLLLNALFFINVTHGQEVLPTININASRLNLNSFSSDFVGDIGPPAKGPTVFGAAFMPVSPRLQCEFTRSLRQDLKNCNFANPPNIGEFRLDMKVGKKNLLQRQFSSHQIRSHYKMDADRPMVGLST